MKNGIIAVAGGSVRVGRLVAEGLLSHAAVLFRPTVLTLLSRLPAVLSLAGFTLNHDLD